MFVDNCRGKIHENNTVSELKLSFHGSKLAPEEIVRNRNIQRLGEAITEMVLKARTSQPRLSLVKMQLGKNYWARKHTHTHAHTLTHYQGTHMLLSYAH